MGDYGDAIEQTTDALQRAHKALRGDTAGLPGNVLNLDNAMNLLDLLADRAGYLLDTLGETNPADAALAPTARAHLQAGHTVVEWYPTDTAGYLTLTAEGDIDIYDIRSGEAGETEEVRCQTCDQSLQIDASIP